MIQVVIPMAGEGRRFRDAGYTDPKPLIDIHGQPMIERVMRSLTPHGGADFTLITRIDLQCEATQIVLQGTTRGAADTLLHAERFTDAGPVMVANCDQLLTIPIDPFLAAVEPYDAGIVVFNSTNPHHSYVTLDADDVVTCIAEKRVISDNALFGIYWFANSSDMFDYAAYVLATGQTVNGEFYISSILERMIADGFRIKAWEVDVHDKHILGTPEELRIFLDKVTAGKVIL